MAWGVVVGGGPLLLGPPGGDDAYYHAMYAVEHARCWRGGVWWPTWYPDLVDGLGAPEPRARPPLPLAVHAAFALAFDDAVAATSFSTLLVPVAAGLVALGVARRRKLLPFDAALAAAAWAAMPYLVVTLHQRAALQEAWAVAVLPWVLETLLPPRPAARRDVAVAAVAFALVVALQLLVAFMVAVVVAAAHLVSPRRRLAATLLAGVTGLGLAGFSWLPNLLALRQIQASVFTAAWFDWRHRLLLSPGSPDPALAATMTWSLVGIVTAALVVFVTDRSNRRGMVAVLAVAALATLLAKPLYVLVPGFALLQFPWRWLAVASALALLVCLRVERPWRGVALAALLLPVAAADPVGWRLGPGPPLAPSAGRQAITVAATRYGVPPILPPFPAMLPRGVDLSVALSAGRQARRALPPARPEGPGRWRWQIEGWQGEEVTLPLLVAPGWRVTVDGRPVEWRSGGGLLAVTGGPGNHVIEASQTTLPADLAGGAVSAVAIVALALATALRSRRNGPSVG